MTTNLKIRYAIRDTLSIIGMGAALFWSAGKWDWWPAWASLAVSAAWLIATAIVIFYLNPDLLVERMGARKGAKTWDTVIVSIVGLVTLVRYIVAGLDQRFAWSGPFPPSAQIFALMMCVLGYTLFVWAVASNAFFSQIVRIQADRGHAVKKGGPYRFIRHPAYLGTILYELAVSILLASWWAFLISGLSVILLIIRTTLEDQTLRAELMGYSDYAHQVRYRLIPGIW